MRIIAGEYRGRRIASPPEQTTRPTTDRVREAIFSSLESMRGGLEGACVFDAFAGSGAMAIEALSRGAERAYLLEKDKRAYDIAKQNLLLCDIDEHSAQIAMADAFAFMPALPDGLSFDVVFLDPPYSERPQRVLDMIEKLACAGIISEHAIYIYEHDQEATAQADAAYNDSGYALIKRRNYGRVVIDTLQTDIYATM